MKRARVNSLPAAVTGFTLVELLLAITLMSILLALTYSGLRAASRSTESGEELLAFTGGMRASHQFVRRQLNQMLPLAFAELDDAEQTRAVFLGDSREIWFVAPMPGYLGAGGPQVQVLELAEGDDGDVLQFRHALLQYFEEEYLFERDPVILLEGVASAGFEFVGLDEEGVLTPWMTTWDEPGSLPVAVRLSIEFDEDRNVHWPAMVAGVRVDEEALQVGSVRPSYEQAIMELSRTREGRQ
jgi:general secretion pathway protein J